MMGTLPTTQVKPKPNTHTHKNSRKGGKKKGVQERERESRVNCLVFILRIPTTQYKKPKVRATSIKIKTQHKKKMEKQTKNDKERNYGAGLDVPELRGGE